MADEVGGSDRQEDSERTKEENLLAVFCYT